MTTTETENRALARAHAQWQSYGPTMDGIRAALEAVGSHFFDRNTLRFFRSRILSDVFSGSGGVYFVTSEQFEFRGQTEPRAYTVRQFHPETATIDTVGEFQTYPTAGRAKTAAKRFAKAGTE